MNKTVPLMWAARIWIAFVFIQSLFFKFTLSPETQYIFGTLGEWMGLNIFASAGPYVIGTLELVAALLLLCRYWAWGALLAFEIMCVAVVFHLATPLGIQMPVFENGIRVIGQNDGGQLFIMACLTLACAGFLTLLDFMSVNSRIKAGLHRLTKKPI